VSLDFGFALRFTRNEKNLDLFFTLRSLRLCDLCVISSNVKKIQNTFGGLAAFVDSGDNEVGTAHHVTAGEYLGVAGLVLAGLFGRGYHAAACVDIDAEVGEPGLRAGTEAEGHHHTIGGDNFL